jgi:hypothetical protein
VKARLSDQHREDWLSAYTRSGPGSAFRRAGEIRRIYEDSAPPISSAMKPPARYALIAASDFGRIDAYASNPL